MSSSTSHGTASQKVPVGDGPYVRAKHAQLVEKDLDRAITLFWKAINAGDRVDSALKDMSAIMSQQNRAEEAIEAITSLRDRCSEGAQESLDNILLELYKKCGRLDEQITLMKYKIHQIHKGMYFNGKSTKTARSQGKKFQLSIEQEEAKLLGNLGWAYMQQSKFVAAEEVYRKALAIKSNNNNICNLGSCLIKQGRFEEAKEILETITCSNSDKQENVYVRAEEMLKEIESEL